MPDEVADRLDAVLADLPALSPVDVTPDQPVAGPPPTDLAAARRRRTARSLLVAAAAVAVLGVGLHQLTGSDEAATDTASRSEAGGAAQESAPAPADADAGGGDRSDQPAEGTQPRVPLTTERFTAQVGRIQPRSSDGPGSELASEAGAASRTARAGCPTTGWGPGRLVPVSYDGAAGALVYRPPTGDTQIVDLFLCGEQDPTRSITLTAP